MIEMLIFKSEKLTEIDNLLVLGAVEGQEYFSKITKIKETSFLIEIELIPL